MKKTDNHQKNGEDRKGFWRIGYLENQEYPKRFVELTRRPMDHTELDNSIEQARLENRELFFDDDFELVEEEYALYGLFPTGVKAYHKNKEIYGGFYRLDTSSRWKGVYLEQDTEILQQILANQRKRSALEDYTYIYDYRHIAKICSQEFHMTRSTEDWANHIGSIFMEREKENAIYEFPTGSYFAAEKLDPEDPQLYYWMERNDKPGVRQKGFGISLVDETDLLEKWSEYQHKYTLDRMVFPTWEAQEHFVAEVANVAMPENWGRMNHSNPDNQYGFPVLKSYLEYTLIRLRYLAAQKDNYILKEDDRVYFNTGLLNKFFRQILVGAELKMITQEIPGLGIHELEYYYDPYIIVSGHDTKFPTANGLSDFPKLAVYFERKEDVLYDASLEIMLNDEHIFEDGLEEGRIPMFREEYLQAKDNPEELKNLHIQVQARVQTAIQRAQLLAERNYKLAVPQFWKETGEVQFLLPLYMEGMEYTGRPECALALRRSPNGQYYEGATILSLDMAYNNARLIAKPDVTWLERTSVDTSHIQDITPTVPRVKEDIAPIFPIICEPNDDRCLATAAVQEAKQAERALKEMPGVPPDPENIGKEGLLTNIVSRPSGKGLRGELLESSGTVARSLLQHPVPHYTGGTLKVRIVDINPQGNQYILEPIEPIIEPTE